MHWRGLLVIVVVICGLALGIQLLRFGALAFFRPETPVAEEPELPDLQVAASEPARIVFLGTSLTSRGQEWPRELERRLSACRGGDVQVRRVARPAIGSEWGRRRIDEALAGEDGPPHLLIMEFSIGDSSLARGVSLGRSAELTDEMLDKARAAEVPVLLSTMNPGWRRDDLERPGQKAYRDIYRERAALREDVALIDMVPLWEALPLDRRRKLVPDHLHPSDEGMMEIYVPALVRALSPHLCG